MYMFYAPSMESRTATKSMKTKTKIRHFLRYTEICVVIQHRDLYLWHVLDANDTSVFVCAFSSASSLFSI